MKNIKCSIIFALLNLIGFSGFVIIVQSLRKALEPERNKKKIYLLHIILLSIGIIAIFIIGLLIWNLFM